MGLNTPAGFWVTIVLVTAVDPVGERAGLVVVTRGPVGLKLNALGPVWPGWISRMLGALRVTGVTPRSIGVTGRPGEG